MLITTGIAKQNLVNYSNKNNKIVREVKNENLFKVVKGLYETDPNTPGYLLASSIYGPSYISFEYALSFYGLIPERVTTITCATFNKKKKKIYNTMFGTFTYRDVPKDAYPEETLICTENNYSYQIATAEKAICDKIYTMKPIKNIDNLKILLFSDLRISEEEFKKLDVEKISKLSLLYHSTNVNLLAKLLRRYKDE